MTCIANPISVVPKMRWGEALPSKIQVSQSINGNSVLGPKPGTFNSLGFSFHYPCTPAQVAQFTLPRNSSQVHGHFHLLPAEQVVELAPHTLDPLDQPTARVSCYIMNFPEGRFCFPENTASGPKTNPISPIQLFTRLCSPSSKSVLGLLFCFVF